MNIHDLSRRASIPVATLRKLERLGVLKVDAESEAAAPLRSLLGRNQYLSLAQLFELVDKPALFDELGKWEPRARQQVADLGDLDATTVWAGVPSAVIVAASGEAEALNRLADWVQFAIPSDRDVSYHWLAIRLLRAQFPNARAQTLKTINLAFAKLRGVPKMKGWWHSVPFGARNTIIYRRPFDL